MTDRQSGYIVVLERDIREDDAEATITALKQVKGVLNVTPIVEQPMVMIGEARARVRLAQAFADFYEKLVK